MHEMIFQLLKWIHIATGAIALFSGLAALMLYRKTPLHRPAGKVFFYSMIVVFATSVPMAIWKDIDFLFCIAFLSFYSAFRGFRALRFLKGRPVSRFDFVAGAVVLLCGFYMIGLGSWAMVKTGGVGILFLFFGAVTVWISAIGLRELRKMKPGEPKWFRVHQGSMGGALIATITAFSATTLDFLPGLVQWLWPTILLSPLLAIFIRSYPTRTSS